MVDWPQLHSAPPTREVGPTTRSTEPQNEGDLGFARQVEQLQQQSEKSTLPAGPIIADREIKKLQSQVRNLEQSFWHKDQQLRALDRKRMTLIRRIGRLRGFVDKSRCASSSGSDEPCPQRLRGGTADFPRCLAVCGMWTINVHSSQGALYWSGTLVKPAPHTTSLPTATMTTTQRCIRI